MSPASPAAPADRFSPDPEPSLWQRALSTLTVCGLATALFLWVAGYLPGERPIDGRFAVAACWDAIEQNQYKGGDMHDMRVACQQLESAQARPRTQLVAAGE